MREPRLDRVYGRRIIEAGQSPDRGRAHPLGRMIHQRGQRRHRAAVSQTAEQLGAVADDVGTRVGKERQDERKRGGLGRERVVEELPRRHRLRLAHAIDHGLESFGPDPAENRRGALLLLGPAERARDHDAEHGRAEHPPGGDHHRAPLLGRPSLRQLARRLGPREQLRALLPGKCVARGDEHAGDAVLGAFALLRTAVVNPVSGHRPREIGQVGHARAAPG